MGEEAEKTQTSELFAQKQKIAPHSQPIPYFCAVLIQHGSSCSACATFV